MIGWPRNGPHRVADQEHPHAAMFIGARPNLAADEPIEDSIQPLGILHVQSLPHGRTRRTLIPPRE